MTQKRRFAIIPSVRGLSAEATAELAKQGASAVRNPLNPRGASDCGWLFRISCLIDKTGLTDFVNDKSGLTEFDNRRRSGASERRSRIEL